MGSLLPEQIESVISSNSSELRSVYQLLCKSPDGLLGHREVSQMLRGIGVKATAQELKDLIKDVVGDEPKIDFDAFVVFMTRKYKQLSFDEEISSLFETLDANKDGFVDAHDIFNTMQSRGVNMTLGEAQALLLIISDSQQGLTKGELKTFVQTKM
jgi:Ca2+-binding EF-hand superfamily protein